MGAADRSRRREVKKATGIKEQGFLAAVTVEEERGGGEGGGEEMRSDRDLDSKTPRHNRQGLTPCEPPHPPNPSTSVKTITERRGAAGGEGPAAGRGSTPRCTAFGLSISNSHQLSAASKTSGNSWKGNFKGNVLGAMFG